METSPIRTAKLCRESCACWAHLRVCSPLQDIYLKRCKSRAAKILKDSTHPGNHLFILLPSGKRFRSMIKNCETQEELLPSGHQAPKHKLGLITSTWLHLIICKISIILHHPYCCYVYIPCTTCLHIPRAHSCLYYYLLNPQYTVCTLYFIAHFILLFFLIT